MGIRDNKEIKGVVEDNREVLEEEEEEEEDRDIYKIFINKCLIFNLNRMKIVILVAYHRSKIFWRIKV